jgi:hypothetical protein
VTNGSRKAVDRCSHCGKHRDEVALDKCPVCHKLFCWSCGKRRMGKVFCSNLCGDYFFFGDEDDQAEE